MVEYEIKWWSDYIEADILKRGKMVSELPFIKEIFSVCNSKIPLKYKKSTISSLLQSFFDDCIDEMNYRR